MKLSIQEPTRPRQIAKANFSDFEVITQANVGQVIEDVERGDREPLNHVMIPYQSYLNLASWMEGIDAYIAASEVYFEEVRKRIKEIK